MKHPWLDNVVKTFYGLVYHTFIIKKMPQGRITAVAVSLQPLLGEKRRVQLQWLTFGQQPH